MGAKMKLERGPGPRLEWKFLAAEQRSTIWWRWQLWTEAGEFVATSQRQFDSLSECEQDAAENGYVEPEKTI